jgi:hypothetical protein
VIASTNTKFFLSHDDESAILRLIVLYVDLLKERAVLE